ncbi:MAG TPA: hypothetical protein VJB87_05800 [Candidatus Nanoarchaeia archaeon]|nr:hypothetical protein [Candidatus Nanoarchaeia archaeon]
MNKKILLLAIMMVIASFAVSAASNDYIVSSRGQGFDARSLSANTEQNSIFADFFTDNQKTTYGQSTNYQNDFFGGNYYQNNQQGIQGYQKNLVESYGTCEPGEQTWNQNVLIRKAAYPVQGKANSNQKRSLQITKVKASGCNGYRFSNQESTNYQNQFDVKDMRLQAQQTQERNNLNVDFSREFNRRYVAAEQNSNKQTVEQDRFVPFRGNRAILNTYYPYSY